MLSGLIQLRRRDMQEFDIFSLSDNRRLIPRFPFGQATVMVSINLRD
jgi:hypothetical protein